MGEGLTTGALIGFIGTLIGIAVAILIFYLSNRQAERRFQIQLLFEKRNESLKNLYSQIDSHYNFKTDKPWFDQIEKFLDGFEGSFLPKSLVKEVRNEIGKYRTDIKNAYPEASGPKMTDEQIQDVFEEIAEQEESMPWYEKRELDFQKKREALRNGLKRKIRDSIKEF